MSKIKVYMTPQPDELNEGGIKRVVEAYQKYLTNYGIQFVKSDTLADVIASHVTAYPKPTVLHTHGLYWTADYPTANAWQWKANAALVEAIRQAKQVTVPSAWVAETFQRDMRFTPTIISHGIDWQEWQHNEPTLNYIIGYGKNRIGDVCTPDFLEKFAIKFPNEIFLTTLYQNKLPNNVKLATGNTVAHSRWRLFVQQAKVFINTTKETFGLGILEAMAAGVPVLSYRYGGAVDLIQHGVNGYLAEPGNLDDLATGLNFCLNYRDTLGANGRELAKQWTWEAACEIVAGVYRKSLEIEPPDVSVIIPVYNKPKEQVKRAIDSILAQTKPAEEIIVVNDGSNESYDWVKELDTKVQYIEQQNSGVAVARNTGIKRATGQYICCLDGDDWLEPGLFELCVDHLEKNRQDGIAYSYLRWHRPDGVTGLGGLKVNGEGTPWPPEFNYDIQIRKPNQVPTACVFRRVAWERVGGYRSRYCPEGAGSEDAALWTMIGSIGFGGKRVTTEPLFHYSTSGQTGTGDYVEPNWRDFPWITDEQHPFASLATPKRLSHPIRQYDEPHISVIIPVGPGHAKHVANCLDSLEIQHFRKWEAVVIWDNQDEVGDTFKAYPYVRLIHTGGKGSGAARNAGVKAARAPFVFFLDVDDFLVDMNALTEMMEAWQKNQQIIYSGYYGKATWDNKEAAQAEYKDRLVDYIDKTHQVIFRNNSGVFDCARAQQQPLFDASNPRMPYYLWCTISVLIPKAWHEAIGGFDEVIDTWEDVDYFWRLAREGYCFYRITKPFLLYNYDNGNRREEAIPKDEASLQKFKNRLQYIENKYRGLPLKMCNCHTQTVKTATAGATSMVEGDYIEIVFDFPGSETRGDYGMMLPSPTGQTINGKRIEYNGYSRKRGDRFLVHKADVAVRPDMFVPYVEDTKPAAPVIEVTPLPEPELLEPVLKGTVLPIEPLDVYQPPVVPQAPVLAQRVEKSQPVKNVWGEPTKAKRGRKAKK